MPGLTAIVTGGSRGIGKALVERLARDDYRVAFSFHSNEDTARELQDAIGGDRVFPFQWSGGKDVTGLERVLERFKSEGRGLDLLVNNAGITRDGYFALSSPGEFQEVLDVNLVGMASATRSCIRTMMAQKSGIVVNIASIAGILGTEGQTSYSASKAGIMAFTKSLAREVGKYGIRVVCIAPGFVETEMFAKVPLQQRRVMVDRVPLKRAGRPSEIAEVVAFVASGAGSYISGTTLVVDGGLA